MSILEPLKALVKINGDGNCYYGTLSYFLSGSESHHDTLRCLICRYISDNITSFTKLTGDPMYNYLQTSNMMNSEVWATEVEVFATASMLATPTFIYSPCQRDLHSNPTYMWLKYSPLTDCPSTFKESIECMYISHVHDHFEPVIS